MELNMKRKNHVGKPWDQVEIKIGENGEILNKSPYLLVIEIDQ